MQLVSRKFLYVNAGQCSAVSNGQFTFHVPDEFVSTNQEDITKLYLAEAYISYDWDSITANNNQISINGVVYQLPLGSPNVLDLAGYFQSIQSSTQLSVTFNSYNGTFNFQNLANTPTTIDLTSANSCTRQLGFSHAAYTVPAMGNLITATVNVSASNLVIIRSNIKTANYEMKQSDAMQSDVWATVPMNVPSYGLATYRDERGQRSFFYQGRGAFDVTLTLVDQDEDPIVPKQPPYVVVAFETWRNTTAELLALQKQHLNLAQLQLLQ